MSNHLSSSKQKPRPDWVKCVALDDKKMWCGLPNSRMAFVFTDANHAALNGHNHGRLVVCRACAQAIVQALANGHDDPEYSE